MEKVSPSVARRNNFGGILVEKSRFYAKNHIFSNFRGVLVVKAQSRICNESLLDKAYCIIG